MSTTKPTIVFVCGAWHPPDLYAPLLDPLEAAGYIVAAPPIPSVGGIYDDISQDVKVVREAIQSALDRKNDVVVLMHSAGGIIGTEAVQGLGKQAGHPGVIRLIYLCAFAPAEQGSLWDAIGGKKEDWWEPVGEDNKQCKAVDTHNIFFNDLDAESAEELTSRLNSHSVGHFMHKCTYTGWRYIPSSYIICEKDMAIPVHAQEAMSSQPGSNFTIERLAASHTPYNSMPEETCRVVRKALEQH